jgi:L-rhamnose mutarotase
VPRVAFQLRVRAEKVAEYDELHRHVWPELIQEMESFGVTDYSIFRRGQDLFLTLRVDDFDELVRRLESSEVNCRWQGMMLPFWEPVRGKRDDEPFAMMKEVFYMPGNSKGQQ